MNKKMLAFLLTTSLFCIVTFLSGCVDFNNIKTPKEISIKTDAEYNFAVANVKKDFSSLLNLDQLQSGSESEGAETGGFNFNLQKYCPKSSEDDKLQFLTKITLQEIPFDFASYISDTSLGSALGEMKFEQKIEIPKIDITKSEEIDLSVISTAISQFISFSGTTAGGNLSFTPDSELLAGQTVDFSSITYKSGTLVFYFSSSYTGAVTIKYNGSPVLNFFIPAGRSYSYTLPENFTFYSEGMTIEFPGLAFSPIAYTCSVSNGVVSKAGGVTISSLGFNFTTPVDMASAIDSIEYCTIDTGYISIDIKQPEGWSGTTYEKSIRLSGGISASNENNSNTIDLAGKTIRPRETTLKSSLTARFDNASIDFEHPPVLIAKVEVEKIKAVAMELSELTTSQSFSQDLPQEIVNTIKEIKLLKTNIKANYVNSLPEGNNITVSLQSNFLNLNKSKKLISGGDEKKLAEFIGDETVIKIVNEPSAEDEFNAVDVVSGFQIPGSSEEKPRRMLLKNVEPGKNYELSLDVTCDIDWDYVTINTESYSQADSIDTGMNLSVFSDAIKGVFGKDDIRMEIESLPVYLYCSVPDMESLRGAKFTGTAKIYTSEDLSEDLIGEDGMKMVTSLPKLETDDKNIVITNLDDFKYSTKADLAPIINNADSEDTIKFDYDLSFTNNSEADKMLTVYKRDLKQDEVQSIAVVAYIAVPLKLRFLEDLTVNILEMISPSSSNDSEEASDLLGRDGPGISEDVDKYLEIINAAYIQYRTKESPFHGELQLIVDLYQDGTDPQILTLERGRIGVEDVPKLLQTYPLNPSVSLTIPAKTTETQEDNWIYISRNMNFETSIDLTIKAKGEIPVLKANSQEPVVSE